MAGDGGGAWPPDAPDAWAAQDTSADALSPHSAHSATPHERVAQGPTLVVPETVAETPKTLALAASGMERVGWTVWMLTACAGLSGSLFGYDTGYISSVLVSIGTDLGGKTLSHGQEQMVTSATSLGALIGALCAALPSDWFGRKLVIAVANVVFIVGALVQAAAHSVPQMVAGRFIVGLGVGVASMIVPLWISELAPTHLRGRLVTLNVVFLTLGQLIAYAVGAGFSHKHGGWRYTVSGGAIPALVSLASMVWLPESPRYDSRRGRQDRVMRTFQRIFPNASEEYCRQRAEEVSQSLESMRLETAELPLHTRVLRLFSGTNLRALALACGLQALQQLSGFNTLMYYSSKIFESVGFSEPEAVSIIVSGINFLATLVALWFIDAIGRRRAMLYTVPMMSLSLVLSSVFFHFLSPDGKHVQGTNNAPWSYLVLISFMLFVAFYGLGTGNVPWQQGELFRNDTRAIGTSIATAVNWACNLIISSTYLSLVDRITASGAFGFYAGLCALGFVGCLFCYPDTRNLSLEEVHFIFRHSWGIRAADQLRAEKELVALSARARDEGGATEPGAISQPVLTTGVHGGRTSNLDTPQVAASTPRGALTPHEEDVQLDTFKNDPLDQWSETSVSMTKDSESRGARFTGATPAALPLALPRGVREPELPMDEPVVDATSTPRRSISMPHLAEAASEQPVVLCPPVRAAGERTNPLSQFGIRGERLMLFVTCFASLGVFLFGYDQGVMSGIITHPTFEAYFAHPTATQIGTMVAILEVGALLTSLAAGVVADRLGRKTVLLYGAVIFSLGGLVQTFALGLRTMVVGRVLSGFGVGFLSMIVPTYQSEVSPAENRGKLACIEFTGNIVGYMASVWFDYACSFLPGNMAWRMPLLMQPVIGLLLAFGSVLLPESPRWLLDQDRDTEGMNVLVDLHETADTRHTRAKLEFLEIKNNVFQMRSHGDRSYRTMWRKLRNRTLIGMSSQAFAQLNGINVISYYAPLVFESAGWHDRDALLMTGINAIMYVASTVPTWFLVDSWGRRPILLSGALLCALMLTLCGVFLKLALSFTPQAVVVCVVLFNAAFGYSWGPIPWAWTPEIMPLAFRAKGASLSTATNWLFNWIVGQVTPVLQERIQWRLYILHAAFCVASFVVVYFFYPETQGVPLEEMDALFGDEASPVPQDVLDDRASGRSADSEPASTPHTRTSISTHPRFLTEVQASPNSPRRQHEQSLLLRPFHRLYTSVAGPPSRGAYEALRGAGDAA